MPLYSCDTDCASIFLITVHRYLNELKSDTAFHLPGQTGTCSRGAAGRQEDIRMYAQILTHTLKKEKGTSDDLIGMYLSERKNIHTKGQKKNPPDTVYYPPPDTTHRV